MKIRNGFVSNSSSSSFVVVCPKLEYEMFIKNTTPFYKKWASKFRPQTKTFLKEICVVINTRMYSEDQSGMEKFKGKIPENITNYGDKKEPMYNAIEIMSNFIAELEKVCNSVITDSQEY